jgi:hypothetical protein
MSTIHLQVAPRVGPLNPRGSRLAAAVFIAVWRGLERLGQSAPPRATSPAKQAQEVRDMACEVQATDPRFAADLYAAADRHEQLHGVD